MNPQHTTGPFSVYENAPGNKHRFLIHDSAGQTVAATNGDPDHAPDYYRALANARLIAAAPELLAALEAQVIWLDEMAKYLSQVLPGFAGSIETHSSKANVLRAAIAKATGDA